MQKVVGCEVSVSRGNTFLLMCCCLLLSIASTGCGGSKSVQEAPPSELTASAEERKEPLPVTALQPPDPFDVPGYLGKHQRSFLNPSLTRVLRSRDIPTGFWAYPRDLPAHQTLMVSNVYSAVLLSWHITPSPLPLPV